MYQPQTTTTMSNNDEQPPPTTAADKLSVDHTKTQIEHLQKTYCRVFAEIDSMREPKPELLELATALEQAARVDRAGKDEAFATMLYENLAPGLAKRLHKERSNDDNYLKIVGETLESLVHCFVCELRARRFNYSFYAAIAFIFQFEGSIHKFHFQISDQDLHHLHTMTQKWRDDLKVGDSVDVYVKADEKGKLYGWMQGKIVNVFRDALSVEFPKSSMFYDRTVDRWSTDLLPFQTKTREDYEWRDKHLIGASMFECDLHDKQSWNKCTILEVKKKTEAVGRVVLLGNCAQRVYRDIPNCARKDALGTYEGWSEKFDEWVPLYSPRIMPWGTRFNVHEQEQVTDDALDDNVIPTDEFPQVFAVPRPQVCISSVYLRMVNILGNAGCFDTIISLLKDPEAEKNNEGLDMKVMSCLSTVLTAPHSVYHKSFIEENGRMIADLIKDRLVRTPDSALRDVKKDQIDGIFKSIENISRRFMPKEQRETEAEKLRLEMCNKSLKSSYLERRIQGIKDLCTLIKNNSLYNQSKTFTPEFLIDWLIANDTIKQVWDSKQTHVQLVQRSSDILKLLLREYKMDEPLLNLFWSLTKSEYQSEVVKLIQEASFYLRQPQIEFFFNEIMKTPSESLTTQDLELLCDLGKQSKEEEFQKRIQDFLWKIIVNPNDYSADLLSSTLSKFRKLVEYWSLERKQTILQFIVEQPVRSQYLKLKLMTEIIEDAIKRSTLSTTYGTGVPGTRTATVTTDATGERVTKYERVTDSGMILTSYSYSTPQEESIYNVNNTSNPSESSQPADTNSTVKDKELTPSAVLNHLQAQGLIDQQLESLRAYCSEVAQNAAAFADPKKTYVACKHFSHSEEIEQRMTFFKFFAKNCDYHFGQVQLRVIYDSLSVKSPFQPSDGATFLKWCKTACQESNAQYSIMDLVEVGELFSDLLNSRMLDVTNLPVDGFEFLQNYFISVNEKPGHLVRVQKKKPMKSYQYNYGYVTIPDESSKETGPEEPEFSVKIDPSQLMKLDLVWTIVMQAQNSEVAPRAVKFLISIYMSLSEEIQANKAAIIQDLINKCINRLAKPDCSDVEVLRSIEILKCVIADSENKGTGNVNPHNAILAGECFDRIIIKNGTLGLANNLVVKLYTSATVWEFVDRVSRMCDLAPQFVTVKLSNGTEITNSDYGKTLGQIGIRNFDIITVTKNSKDDGMKSSTEADLIDPVTKQLTERADLIFNQWYDKYCDQTGVMTPESTVRFIYGATYERVEKTDNRITGLFEKYQTEKGKLTRQQFIQFYTDASSGVNTDRVFDNLRNHFIRNDLVKLSEVKEELPFAENDMPRNSMSHNQQQFETLMGLLSRDKVSAEVWELIRSLATNQQIYRQVLEFEIPHSDGSVKISEGHKFWQLFFESGSIYQQSYQHEIIQALMQDSEDLTNRVFLVGFQDKSAEVNAHVLPKVQYRPTNKENEKLKQDWSTKFLQNGGFQYIIDNFLKRLSESIPVDKFKLQELSFMSTMMQEYLPIAIQARKSDPVQTNKVAEIMNALNILDSLDFPLIQTRLLQMIAQLVRKDQFSLEEKTIIQSCLKLWESSLFFCPDMFEQFLAYDQVSELLMSGLLYCNEQHIRLNFKETLSSVAKNLIQVNQSQTAYGFLLKLLSQNFHKISQYCCNEFFELFNELVDLHFIKVQLGTQEKDLFDPQQLLGQIIDNIKSENARQKASSALKQKDEIQAAENAQASERLIIGLVLLTKKMIKNVDAAISEAVVIERDLINEIFREFLFSSIINCDSNSSHLDAESMLDIVKSRGPRTVKSLSQGAKVNRAREVAYDLLNDLVCRSPLIMTNFIQNQLTPLLMMVKKPKKWNYQPSVSSERVQKYVGLRNLGCICYMNSMMQQFFMIPAFRYNLLCVDDGVPEEPKEYKNEVIDDNMLHQMQKLFAHLELSERSEYNPLGFTFAFKELDGNPTNISEQKDAQEFLNVLFDRLENALKSTPRKYLLQSVFQGKTCSQLVCMECGKTTNRIEDMLNLSLTVKDLKSVEQSLEALVRGEVIQDFKCEGCNKKVDIHKRTLIAETPNVLILHLQRILFNFETFQNDKDNQYFEFPQVLDLKPYSYHEVMKKDNLAQKPKPKTDSDDDEPTEETKAAQASEDLNTPIEDDCFEYKLVGVNVHSGSANAGHYWSYINTMRGHEAKAADDPTWGETGNEPWMEYNDSTVKDFQFDKLKQECFGGNKGNSTMSAWSIGGNFGGYGQSGYMLFYERRLKKPIKIVVPPEEVSSHTDLTYDEKKNEHIKFIDYRQGVHEEKPNLIFSQVLQDNTKFKFESDVYSQDFFDFVKSTMRNVLRFGNSQDPAHHNMRCLAIKAARRAAFDIVARSFHNQKLHELIYLMIEIFEQDSKLAMDFLSQILEDEICEPIFEMLLDAEDEVARRSVGRLFNYLVVRVKIEEIEQLKGEKFEDTISARLMDMLASQLLDRVAKQWKNLRAYLQLFEVFALYNVEQVLQLITEEKISLWNQTADFVQVGLGYFYRSGKLEVFLDFILADKSPLFQEGQSRYKMGSNFMQPDFEPLMRVVCEMTANQQLAVQYPPSEITVIMMSKKAILEKIFSASSADPQNLIEMCRDNLKMTTKVSKLFVKAFRENSINVITTYLRAVGDFLTLKDSLQRQRLEWVLGIPQLKCNSPYRSLKCSYGVENVERIGDTSLTYLTTLPATFQTTATECLLEKLLTQKNRFDHYCCKGVQELIKLCLRDETIADYVCSMPAHNYQYARYTDWFREYLQEQVSSSYGMYQKELKALAEETLLLMPDFEQLLLRLEMKHAERKAEYLATNAYQHSWMPEHPLTLRHFPPAYIVGAQSNPTKQVLNAYEDAYCSVKLFAVECEYMYSNPTGLFNLSLPEKLVRTKNYTFQSLQDYLRTAKGEENAEPNESIQETRQWAQHSEKAPVLMQLYIRSKCTSQLRVAIQIGNGQRASNVAYMPITPLRESVFREDEKIVAHFMKIDPRKDWDCDFTIAVEIQNKDQVQPSTTPSKTSQPQQQQQATPNPHSIDEMHSLNSDAVQTCQNCNEPLYLDQQFCRKCQEMIINSEDYGEQYDSGF